MQERQFVVGSPGYFKDNAPPVVPKDLLGHHCILGRLDSGAIWQWEFERQGTTLRLEVQGRLTLDEPNAMLDAALAGIGVAYLNEVLVEKYIETGRLIPVLQDWTQPYPGISLYFPGRKHVPAGLRAFIDLIRQFCRKGN
jgi:DNA-binding transcriptional LysR family regulator